MVQLNSIIQAGLNEMFLMSKDFENADSKVVALEIEPGNLHLYSCDFVVFKDCWIYNPNACAVSTLIETV
jgi:hypothetical protein